MEYNQQTDYRKMIDRLKRCELLMQPNMLLDECFTNPQQVAQRIRRVQPDWIEVRGITDFLKKLSAEKCAHTMENVLTGMARGMRQGSLIAICLENDGERLHIRLGCSPNYIGMLVSTLKAVYPGIDLLRNTMPVATGAAGEADPRGSSELFCYGGLLTGYPSLLGNEQSRESDLPVDILLRGIGSRPFRVTVLAELKGVDAAMVNRDMIREAQKTAMRDSEKTISSNGFSEKLVNADAQAYLKELEKAQEMMEYACNSGLWSVGVFYAAADQHTAAQLGGMLATAYNQDSSSVLESVIGRTILYRDTRLQLVYQGILHGDALVSDMRNFNFVLNMDPALTLMSSRELSRYLALPQREYAGYYVDSYVEFDVDVRPNRMEDAGFELGDIVRTCQPDADVEGTYAIKPNDLTRHALVIGLTGGGKSNTSKGLLRTLWVTHHVPFLVIESAKREYWELSRLTDENGSPLFPELNVFTVGDENPKTASPFRLNPMEAMPGVSLQTHIDYLLSTFKAAFELYPPMPYVLETAVYKVYEDRGWDIVTGENRFGQSRYPMLEELQQAVVEVTDNLNYDNEVASNVKAALTARIHSLMIGAKDFMMNTPRSIDVEYLLSRPTVLELEDLGDDDTKAFVIGILLVRIYEYRKAMQYSTAGKALKHMIMVEEAHRLLKNVQATGEGDQSRAKAVEFFCNMLAEIRSFGQGFLIADQVPTKLAPDTLKNTNLKIVHRTVMQEDREAIGRSMNMTQEQVEYLSALRVGCAAVFGEGDNRPKLVRFPEIKNGTNVDRRAFIVECGKRIRQENVQVFARGKKFASCAWCQNTCAYYEEVEKKIQDMGGMGMILNMLNALYRPADSVQNRAKAIISFCKGLVNGMDQQLCLSGSIMKHLGIHESEQAQIAREIVAIISNADGGERIE